MSRFSDIARQFKCKNYKKLRNKMVANALSIWIQFFRYCLWRTAI